MGFKLVSPRTNVLISYNYHNIVIIHIGKIGCPPYFADLPNHYNPCMRKPEHAFCIKLVCFVMCMSRDIIFLQVTHFLYLCGRNRFITLCPRVRSIQASHVTSRQSFSLRTSLGPYFIRVSLRR